MSPIRRLRVNLYYLRQPLGNFLPLVGAVTLLVVLGGVCFHKLYHQRQLSLSEGIYLTYCLIFMEHLEPFPEHWVLRFFYVVLPPLGLVVILDGIVRFSYHILRKDVTSKEWVRAMAITMNNHVILCGLGKVGLRVLQQLLRLGEQVVVLEKDAQCPNLAFARRHGIPVLNGSGREEGILDELNVTRAKSIILATDDDLANLELALDARKAAPDVSVVLRMFDQELASKIHESFDIHQALSTSAMAAPLFATASSDRSIVSSFYVGDDLLVVANLTVRPGSKLIGRTLGELGPKHRAFFLTHCRNKKSDFYPPANTAIQEGDEITVQTEPETLKRMHELNRDPQPY